MSLRFRQFETPQDYLPVFQAMKDFTLSRTHKTTDEVWLLEHTPVFTQGQAGKPEHILNPHNIPVLQSDRGGQVTYHGPGQLMIYPLLELKRYGLGVRDAVDLLENLVVKLLQSYDIQARGDQKARGVYVGDAKIASIGLRIRKGYSYHGLSLNVKMDLTPFSYINPCGFESLPITQIAAFEPNITLAQISKEIETLLIDSLTSK
ncbi:MAG: lipoyl(octanoyl) transferase LipB [Gammaproteobacteria bacterium]